MRRMLWGILSVWVLSLAAVSVTQAQNPARDRIKSIENYMVYYGEGRAADLARFDLVILQPDTLTDAEIAELKAAGVLTIAYLSVGEAEPDRAWFEDGRVDSTWLLGQNEDWGSYFVDARQTGWQALMLALGGEFLARGYDGLFLDTVDTVELYPDTTPGMIALIQGLREAYPDALLVQNRGFGILEDTTPFIDAVMFEDLSTSYDFETGQYIRVDNSATAQELIQRRDQTGLVVLALDYAPAGDTAAAQQAINIARQYGFIPAVSVIALDNIPDYGLTAAIKPCAPTPADMEGPYYLPDAPFKEVMYPAGMAGQRLIISGTVYAADCMTPLAGAVVDVWQADASGEYDFSDQYILRGKVKTDENGRYTFETILPAPYEPRPPHIHIKISHPQAQQLTTQLYFEGNNNQGQRGVVIATTRDGDVLRGTFNVVLGN